MKTFKITVVSVEEEIYSGDASFVVFPGVEGDFGVLAGHAPLVANIRPGTLRIELADKEAQEVFLFVSGGIVEIHPDGVNVLADTVERGVSLDQERIEASYKLAQEKLKEKSGNVEELKVEAEIALAKMATIRQLHKSKR